MTGFIERFLQGFPGGAVAPSQEIYEEIRKAVTKKKVIVSMGSVAASGGCYIAAPATRIVANPGTLTAAKLESYLAAGFNRSQAGWFESVTRNIDEWFWPYASPADDCAGDMHRHFA